MIVMVKETTRCERCETRAAAYLDTDLHLRMCRTCVSLAANNQHDDGLNTARVNSNTRLGRAMVDATRELT